MKIWRAIRNDSLEALRARLPECSPGELDWALQVTVQTSDPKLEILGLLLEQKPSQGAWEFAVLQASQRGAEDTLSRLLESSFRYTPPTHGETPLLLAAEAGQGGCVALLLASGHDPNTLAAQTHAGRQEPDGRSPLLAAIRSGEQELLSQLIAGGARVNFSTLAFRSPLQMARSIKASRGILQILKDAGALSMEPSFSDLATAARWGYEDRLAELMEHSSQSERERAARIATVRGRRSILSALMEGGLSEGMLQCLASLAAEHRRLPMLRFLLSTGQADLESPDRDSGLTPLHAAARGGHLDVMEFCLEKGAFPNQPDAAGAGALHHAALTLNVEAVEFLLKEGARRTLRDESGRKALHYLVDAAPGIPKASERRRAIISLLKPAPTAAQLASRKVQDIKKQLSDHARSSWTLNTEEGEGDELGSRLGGQPWMGVSDRWPRDARAQPMVFLMQIWLADWPLSAGAGLLRIFVPKDPARWNRSALIMHTLQPDEGGLMAPPYGVETLPAQTIRSFAAGKRDYPLKEWAQGDAFDFSEQEQALLDPLCQAGDKVGGWPRWDQEIDYRRGCRRLLLQLSAEGVSPGACGPYDSLYLVQDEANVSRFGIVWQKRPAASESE